jgi:5-methylcytosine-specific restriction endonuclease McrA
MNKCLNCNTNTKNPKFCNKSCAASYNNKKSPKRKKTSKVGICIICGKQSDDRRKYCQSCKSEHDPNYTDWSKLTLLDLQNKRKYQINSRIRELARRKFWKEKDIDTYSCPNCGYKLHIEVCHIVPINSFSEDTKVTEINSSDNLIGLCKNCHWEFDNGLLDISKFT